MSLPRSKQHEYRANLVGMQFASCPSQQMVRVFIAGEILSAVDFPSLETFISYTVDLPSDWKKEMPGELTQTDLSEEELEEFNCLGSVTHSVQPLSLPGADGKVLNHFHFCFPIDLQLLAPETSIKQKWPVIHFQLTTVDSWERTVLVGCGFIEIPRQIGLHNVSAKTWKPIGGLQSRVSEFFIGGSTKVKHLQKISQSQVVTDTGELGPNNRSLYHTESTGEVFFRFNVAYQSRKSKTDERKQAKDVVRSEATEQLKEKAPRVVAPFVNTGTGFSSRFSNSRLQ